MKRRPCLQDPLEGFTLIELMIAVALMAGILGSAYLCLHTGLESQKEVEARMDVLQNGRVALALMTADLHAATSLCDDFDFLGVDRTLGDMEADNLDFATRNWRPEAPGEGDLAEISYYADRNSQTGEFGLWRRRDPSPDGAPLDGGEREEIAPGLRALRLEYFDGFDWYETWGEESPARRQASNALRPFNLDDLPDAVRITIALSSPGKRAGRDAGEEAGSSEASIVFQTVVHLNLAERIRTQGVGGAGTGSSSGGNAPSQPEGTPQAQGGGY